MRRYIAALAASIAMLVTAFAGPASAAVTNFNPVFYGSVSQSGTTLTLNGTVLDGSDFTSGIAVVPYVDNVGGVAQVFNSATSKAEFVQACQLTGESYAVCDLAGNNGSYLSHNGVLNHTTTAGLHQYRFVGSNVGSGSNTDLWTVNAYRSGADSPFGTVDSVSVGWSGIYTFTMIGWTLESDRMWNSSALPPVHVYLDGTFVFGFTPGNGYRSDVAAAFPGYSGVLGSNYLGYNKTMGNATADAKCDATGYGNEAHTMQFYALNTGSGSNTLIGTKTVYC